MALPDLLIESSDWGETEMPAGCIGAFRFLVRNNGQADASMISVRCEMNTELIAIATIPLLEPGELGEVTCDWAIPEEPGTVQIRAMVDRGLEIDEGDETNNEAAVSLTPPSVEAIQGTPTDRASRGVRPRSSWVWGGVTIQFASRV